MSRSLNFDFRKLNPHHSAWRWKNWEAGGLQTLVQGWGRLGTGVSGWAEDGENQEDPWGGGGERGRQPRGLVVVPPHQRGSNCVKSTEEPPASRPRSAALCSAQRARLPQSPPHRYRHIPSSNEITCVFQLPDVRDRVCFHSIPVPGTVSGLLTASWRQKPTRSFK